jgi:hypothetical protein
MKQFIAAMLSLVLGVSGTLYAQENQTRVNAYTAYNRLSPDDRLFNPPPYSIGIDYTISLDRGNICRLELANGNDIHNFRNIDSLLMVFMSDLALLKDSLADLMTVKRIDYLIDTSGRKKLRIRQFRPAGTSFLLDGNEPALLRLQQDTIYIMVVTRVAREGEGTNIGGLRYDRIGFFLNRYNELDSYITSVLNDEIRQIISGIRHPSNVYEHPFDYIVRQPDIRSRPHISNQLAINPGVAIQNYKNYFSPSFVVGPTIRLQRGINEYRFGAYWEPMFFFAANAQGKLQTYRNDFIVLGYEHNHPYESGGRDELKPAIGFDPAFSLGYCFSSQGNYFTQPSFRLTAGAVKWLNGGLRLEPCLYFNNFFKGVTPGLRFSFGGF